MTQKTLAAQVAELTAVNEQLRERHQDALAQIRPLERKISDQAREITFLQERVQQVEIRKAELKGYLKAVIDRQPTRMVEEARRPYSDDMTMHEGTRAFDDGIPF